MELCTRKNVLNFLGVSYFWGACPPKSQLLAGLTPNAYKEGHSTQPVGGISKKLTYYCSSAVGLQSQRKKLHLIPMPAVPHPKNKQIAVFARFGTFFSQMGGAPRILE